MEDEKSLEVFELLEGLVNEADFGYWMEEEDLTRAIDLNALICWYSAEGHLSYGDVRILLNRFYGKIVAANRQR